MGESGVSSSRLETPRETSVDAIHEEQRFPQGPDDSANHLSNPPRTDLIDLKNKPLKLGVPLVPANLEGPPNANSREALNEELKTASQGLEHQFQEQKCWFLRKQKEITSLQRDTRDQFRELITKDDLRAAQVVGLQDTVRQMNKEIGQLRQDVNKLPSSDDVLDAIEMLKMFGQLRLGKSDRLREDLRQCHIQFKSATEDMNIMAREMEKLKETILILEESNNKLEQRNDKIQQQLCKERAGQDGSYVDGQQTPFLLESTAKEMFSSIATFSSLLSKYTDSNGFNPAHIFIARNFHGNSVRIAREHHWTYLLKRFICSCLFAGFQTERFVGFDDAVMFLDHEERVRKCFEYFMNCKDKGVWNMSICHAINENFDCLFIKYFTTRLHLLPEDIRFALFGLFTSHDEHAVQAHLHTQLSCLPADQQKLVQSLIVAAEKVWQFHKLCLSFEPPATVIAVSDRDPFNEAYMESIDAPENIDRSFVPKVAFMTYPGFRLRKSIIKCQVYLASET